MYIYICIVFSNFSFSPFFAFFQPPSSAPDRSAIALSRTISSLSCSSRAPAAPWNRVSCNAAWSSLRAVSALARWAFSPSYCQLLWRSFPTGLSSFAWRARVFPLLWVVNFALIFADLLLHILPHSHFATRPTPNMSFMSTFDCSSSISLSNYSLSQRDRVSWPKQCILTQWAHVPLAISRSIKFVHLIGELDVRAGSFVPIS